ncbi:MAG: LamG domain-containing protein [Candidatus Roizmanbacteria bacterium]
MIIKKNSGTTLVEVLVASGILISIITLLTVALTSTFEGYGRVLSSAQVEQDAQYIIARIQYATTRADRNTLGVHTTSADFSTGALNNTQVNTSSNGEVGLVAGQITGTFTSAPIALTSSETIRSFTSNATLPANTSIGYQVGIRGMVASACLVDSAQYGYAWDTTGAAPIAWYKMDEATWNGTADEVKNTMTNTYNGTSSGGVYTTSSGQYGRAGKFDGVNDYVGASVPMTQTDNWTLSAWVYPSALPQLGTIISNGNGTGVAGDGYAFGIGNGSGASGSKLQGTISGTTYIDSGYTFATTNTWYHVTMERASGTIKFYVNGVQTANTSASVPTTPTVFRIGSQTAVRYFNGLIDDIRIYNYVRSQAQIVTDMGGYVPRPLPPVAWYKMDESSWGSVINSSGLPSTSGTSYNGATVTSSGKYNGAGSFDGSNDYVEVPHNTSLAITGNLTISAWVKPTDRVNANGIVGKTSTNTPAPYDFYLAQTSGLPRLLRGNGTLYAFLDAATAPANGQWSHVAVVMSGTTATHYLNGVANGSGTISTTIADSGGAMRIASRADLGTIFKGSLDDVRIYNYARTQEQIADDMNGADPINVVDYFTLPTGTPITNYANPGQCIIYKTTYTRSATTDSTPQTLDVTIKK